MAEFVDTYMVPWRYLWSPIEFAPKDGTRVLLVAPGHCPWIGEWVDAQRYAMGHLIHERKEWTTSTVRVFGIGDTPAQPTHWMTIPDFDPDAPAYLGGGELIQVADLDELINAPGERIEIKGEPVHGGEPFTLYGAINAIVDQITREEMKPSVDAVIDGLNAHTAASAEDLDWEGVKAVAAEIDARNACEMEALIRKIAQEEIAGAIDQITANINRSMRLKG